MIAQWSLLILAAVMLAAPKARAESPVTQYSFTGGAWQTTVQAACNSRQSASNAQTCAVKVYDIVATAAVAGNYCSETYTQCSNGAGVGTYPYGPAQTRSWCVAANAAPVNGVCPPPTDVSSNCTALTGRQAPGVVQFSATYAQTPSGTTYGCESQAGGYGCTTEEFWDVKTQGTNRRWTSNAVSRYTGAVCDYTASGNGSTSTTTAPVQAGTPATSTVADGIKSHNDCAVGSYYGQVNGENRCIPGSGAGNVTTNTPSTNSTTDANGNNITRNVTTETSCNGTMCTTTTTTRTTTAPAGGGTPITTTTTATDSTSRTQFCSQNSNAVQCGGGGGSGNGSGSGSGSGNEGGTITDGGAPGQPTLYTRTYTNGMAGVWDQRKSQLTGGPLAQTVTSLMPSISESGTPPTFSLDLDLGPWANFGQHSLAPDSSIWAICKTIIILSALLLARALVFGG